MISRLLISGAARGPVLRGAVEQARRIEHFPQGSETTNELDGGCLRRRNADQQSRYPRTDQ